MLFGPKGKGQNKNCVTEFNDIDLEYVDQIHYLGIILKTLMYIHSW